MGDTNVQPINSPIAPESQNRRIIQPEATLQDVLDTMHNSDLFPRTGNDAPSRFWSAYERVARQHDYDLIDRHYGEMDVLLIFAGLFSAVSSAFIVNMQSSLSPIASDTTNALLKMLVNKIDNTTFPAQETTLPIWTGPSATTIWIQTLAYMSLSSSLLAAFGAVLGKQWLGNFKTTRFGRGALHERCQRRQQKLDGLEAWYFSTILATLPIFLQLSLFFFGIALSANIWTLQRTVASVIVATTAFGLIFYFFTMVSSLKSPDCPFQTPVSTVLQHVLRNLDSFPSVVRKKWVTFLDRLRKSSRRVLYTTSGLITKMLMCIVASPIPSVETQVGPLVTDPETVATEQPEVSRGVELPAVAEKTSSFKELDLRFLEPPIETSQIHAVQSRAVQWILETSTDMDNIAAAAEMVPEVVWPSKVNIAGVLDRLKNHFYACFDLTQQILPLAQTRATACLKAMCHFDAERDLGGSFVIYKDGDIYSRDDRHMYHMLPDQGFLIVRCAVGDPVKLDIASLPLCDRMWMAQMFTYRLHRGDNDPEFVAFVIDFIGICLDSKSPARLVVECVLLAGLLIGLPIDRRHLASLDKSKAIDKLRESVMNRMLDVLLGEIPGRHETALKLIHPLLQDIGKTTTYFRDRRMLDRALSFCFRLLQEDSGTTSENRIRSRSLTSLIRVIARHQYWFPRDRLTPVQFNLLLNYQLQIGDGTDYHAFNDTFEVLAWLGGQSSEYPKEGAPLHSHDDPLHGTDDHTG